MNVVVYIATNSINGKSYIGWTVNFQRRKKRHLRDAQRGLDWCFQRAIRKYGKESFVWEILWEGEGEEEAKSIEIQMIQEHRSLAPEGYNMTEGGDGGLNPCNELRSKLSAFQKGKKVSATTRAKMSKAHIGLFSGEKHPLYGKKHSDITKAKISVALSGANNPMYGKKNKLSVATRAKMSMAQTGRKHSSLTKAKMSAARKDWWERKNNEK